MNDLPSAPKDDEPARLPIDESDEIGSEFASFFKRRIVMWAVRWTIGFALTGVLVSFRPEYEWLWWITGGLALVSLLLLLLGQWLVQRKLAQTTTKIDDVNAIVREDHERSEEPRD